jgi:HK97 family phage portal protein
MGIFDRLFRKKSLQSVHSNQGWTSLFVQEPYSGAWQKNDELTREDMTAHHAVFTCVSLISQDIGKMPIQLKKQQKGVLVRTEIPSKFRVLNKPNRFQIWQQFSEHWTTSLLLRGNTYVLKRRDIFGEVTELVVLNPDLCKPLIDDNGNVFYQLGQDRLNQTDPVIVPAS